jgi:hypothetical protein
MVLRSSTRNQKIGIHQTIVFSNPTIYGNKCKTSKCRCEFAIGFGDFAATQ